MCSMCRSKLGPRARSSGTSRLGSEALDVASAPSAAQTDLTVALWQKGGRGALHWACYWD